MEQPTPIKDTYEGRPSRPTTNQQVAPFAGGGTGGAGRCLRGVRGNAGRADTKKPACAGKVEPVGGPVARLCNRRPI